MDSGKRCAICKAAVYVMAEDLEFAVKHTRGWSTVLICHRCLGNRKEIMREYKKAIGRLLRMAEAKRNKWQGENWDVPMGNGRFRYGRLQTPNYRADSLRKSIAEIESCEVEKVAAQ